ncbi:MAG: PAS fold protein [Candidatus Methanofastidiosum methylothiophilum]|uniref:PAS fold protein n=1 Tax=Candidatus Methanofastidiosum methylothiophilum TaxID=1705564 RepID=A0A150IHN2_9EURY|nr:MAG: PAS fold protein [Candidatus Methanofastidiosum methylthiophilus]KYC46708.1 MAG: PAS fold protein [Candidatus Methanofastidiosum methylthiophilus]KYC49810.1 MAG: PAS fold protein [Candidatus Methanofastidiosum methylthiophilus]
MKIRNGKEVRFSIFSPLFSIFLNIGKKLQSIALKDFFGGVGIDIIREDKVSDGYGGQIQKEYLEERLIEAEKKWDAIFNYIDVPIFLTDENGKFIDANSDAASLLGYSKDEMSSLTPREVLTGEYSKILDRTLNEIQKKDSFDFNVELIKKDGSIIFTHCKSKLISISEKKYILTFVKDLTEKRRSDEDKLREFLEYDLRDSKIYLAREGEKNLAIDAFKNLLLCGYKGVIISSEDEMEYRKKVDHDFKFYRISNHNVYGTIPPDYNRVDVAISGFQRKSVVLIDEMEYLEAKSDYKNTLLFIKSLKEFARIKCTIFILCVDTMLLEDKNLQIFENETFRIERIMSDKINVNMERILKFVKDKNNVGYKPMLTDVGRTLRITRPTIKSNLAKLISKKYLVIHIEGRKKRLEITKKGREILESRIC